MSRVESTQNFELLNRQQLPGSSKEKTSEESLLEEFSDTLNKISRRIGNNSRIVSKETQFYESAPVVNLPKKVKPDQSQSELKTHPMKEEKVETTKDDNGPKEQLSVQVDSTRSSESKVAEAKSEVEPQVLAPAKTNAEVEEVHEGLQTQFGATEAEPATTEALTNNESLSVADDADIEAPISEELPDAAAVSEAATTTVNVQVQDTSVAKPRTHREAPARLEERLPQAERGVVEGNSQELTELVSDKGEKISADPKLDSKGGLSVKSALLTLNQIFDAAESLRIRNEALLVAREAGKLQPKLEAGLANILTQSANQKLDSSLSIDFTNVRGAAQQRTEMLRDVAPKSTMPRPLQQMTYERVEAVIKEAAKSKDRKSLSFRLDPPELGKVKVDISMRDGGLHARLVAESSQVTQLLKERAQDLQMSLRRLGLNLDFVRVSVGSSEFSFDTSSHHSSSESKQHSQTPSSQSAEQQELDFNALDLQASVKSEVNLDHWVA